MHIVNLDQAKNWANTCFLSLSEPASNDEIGYLSEERRLCRKTKILDILVYLAQPKDVKKQAQLNTEFLPSSAGLYDNR